MTNLPTMSIVFVGINTTIWATPNMVTYVVKHGPKKAHRKTFKGETAWRDAQRFAWDLGDLTCEL